MAARRRRPTREPAQRELPFTTWGGRRKNAGRKPRVPGVDMVPHVTRPRHYERHPVHVTVRTVSIAPRLRDQIVFAIIEREIRAASRKGLRVIAFSVQRDHIHLIIEAPDRVMLWRGVQRFVSRVAIAVNRLTHRRGRFWRDRYHRQDLTSPSQVRNTYVYVLMNVRKHAAAHSHEVFTHFLTVLDPCSSARWFNGWHPRAGPPPEALAPTKTSCSPVLPARSWLARKGWELRGLVRFDEVPRLRPRSGRRWTL